MHERNCHLREQNYEHQQRIKENGTYDLTGVVEYDNKGRMVLVIPYGHSLIKGIVEASQ